MLPSSRGLRSLTSALFVLALEGFAWGQLTPDHLTSEPVPPVQGEAPQPTAIANSQCPVMPEETSDPEFHLVYKGRDVYFCCSTCLGAFAKDPDKYLGRLPQFEDVEEEEHTALAALGEPVDPPRVFPLKRLQRLLPGGKYFHRSLLFSVVTLPLAIGILLWLRRRRKPTQSIVGYGALYGMACTTLASLCLASDAERDEMLWRNRDRVHFSSFYDFGEPPIPERPEVEKSLVRRFYRGNDERNPRLFNNGYYRTATFDLSLVDADNQPIDYGDSVAGKELYLRVVIERAPFTADRFFTERTLGRAYLTQDSDPFLGATKRAADRVDWVTLEPMQRWEAQYPLGRAAQANTTNLDFNAATEAQLASIDGVGPVFANWAIKYRDYKGSLHSVDELDLAGIPSKPKARLAELFGTNVIEGVVYVAQEVFEGKDGDEVIGSRFHYGIKYELHLVDGVVDKNSEIWMNFLYRSRKVASWQIPEEEWFSPQPIPELPSKGTDDEQLLGLDEFEMESGEDSGEDDDP